MAIKLGFNATDIYHQNLIKKEDVKKIAEWIKKENLPLFTDERIIQFLLSSDSLIEATKETIRAYVEITNSCDELFSGRNIRRIDLKKYLNVGEICILPERTKDGCMILFNRLVDTNYRNFYMGPYLTVLGMVIDAGLYEFPANGLIVVIDLTGMSWKHMACLRFSLIRTFSNYLQEGLPVKLRKFYMINAIPVVYRVLAMTRPFLRREVLEKMEIFKAADMNHFYKECLPQKYLPVDYGGEMPCSQMIHRKQEEKLESLIGYFEAEEKQRKSLNL